MPKPLFRRVVQRMLHFLARVLPGATSLRPLLHRWRGVSVGRDVFIGDEVYLESEYPEAIEIGRVLDECRYAWFEEPLSPNHAGLFRQLADKVDVPIATGECEQTRWGFQDLLSKGGVHIVQPDLAYCGGPTEALKIRAIASSHGINTIAHAWGTMLNLASAAHFLATNYVEPGRAEPNPPLLEVDRTPNPMRDEMYAVSLDIIDGKVKVPTAPGPGVEPDREAMKKFCIQQTER